MDGPADTYSGFAAHYDLHGWDWFARVYGPRIRSLLADRGIRSARILDAGCGTGTLAIDLAAAGHEVTGVDLSEGMLAVARRKDARGAVAWRQADITSMDLGDASRPFDLVTCVADILNHLESLDAWEAAFRRFAAHLRRGGRLLFDVMTCSGLSHLDKQVVDGDENRTLIVRMIYEPRSRRSTVSATSFVRAGGGNLFERATETIPEWGQPVEAVLERLARAGFGEPERLWASSGDPEAEDRFIVLATRR